MSLAEEGGGNQKGPEDESLSHDHALQSVPNEKRRGLYELQAVWVGWAISVSAFLVGGVVGNGTTLGLVGSIGFRTGLTTYSIGRAVFGKGGSAIVSFLLGFLAMGFIGVLLDGFANSLAALLPAVPKMLSVLVFAVLVTLSSIYGYKGLAVLSQIAAPALFAVLGKAGGFGAIAAKVPAQPIPFFTAVGSAVATWLTGAALCSDIARYAKKESHGWVGALGGYVLGAALLEGLSVITARGVGNANVVVVLSTLGLLIPGVIVLLLALWTTTDNNIYGRRRAGAGVAPGLRLCLPAHRLHPVWDRGVQVAEVFGSLEAAFARGDYQPGRVETSPSPAFSIATPIGTHQAVLALRRGPGRPAGAAADAGPGRGNLRRGLRSGGPGGSRPAAAGGSPCSLRRA